MARRVDAVSPSGLARCVVFVEIDPLALDDEWMFAGLRVNRGDVFAENAGERELHAREEPDRCEECGGSWLGRMAVVREIPNEAEPRAQQAEGRHGQSRREAGPHR